MRAGIIGTGAVAHKHARALQNIGYRVTVCANRREEAGREFATRYGATLAGAWQEVCRHPEVDFVDVCTFPEFRLEPVPPYSPNVNLIERLWKFMKGKALSRWHKTFEAMQDAVSEVMDHLGQYREELATLMVDEFHIIEKQEIPVEYQEVA